MTRGNPRVYAVLGDPVAQSLSPLMHGAAFRALGLDATYVALATPEAALPALMRTLGANGGGNVTVPHKAAAAAALDRPTERVARLGVCNTFWGEDGALAGDNTDVDGVIAAVGELARTTGVQPSAWLMSGTGGAARAVAGAALELGARLLVHGRDAARSAAFDAWARSIGVAPASRDECDLMINATPLGLHPADPMPVARSAAPAARAALDLVYARGETPWVRAMRTMGLAAIDGRTMLVAQGICAFERWFPGVRAPADVMRQAVAGALR